MTATALTFDEKIRLLELDDARKAGKLSPDERAEYSALVRKFQNRNAR